MLPKLCFIVPPQSFFLSYLVTDNFLKLQSCKSCCQWLSSPGTFHILIQKFPYFIIIQLSGKLIEKFWNRKKVITGGLGKCLTMIHKLNLLNNIIYLYFQRDDITICFLLYTIFKCLEQSLLNSLFVLNKRIKAVLLLSLLKVA